jgi:hypothetical protein
MRSLFAAAFVAMAVTGGCSQTTNGSLTVDSATPVDSAPTSDSTACDCHVEGSGADATLVMSWSCYCANVGGCTRTFPAQCTDFRERIDYPLCGMTILHVMTAGGPMDDVYDCNGTLIGTRFGSDTGPYACPSDPTITAFRARAGTFPAATCSEFSRGPCSTSVATCGDGGDGGAR